MSSQPDPETFSIRIVSFDYYTSPPIPDLDLFYSSFHGGKVEEVPVIRIYGATPAGQKTCLHVHRALPYLYIPCPDDVHQNTEEGHAFVHILSSALEKALRLKNSSAPKRQHIHGCSLVQAKKLYGYHSSEELFVKIYLYYPHEVTRAASLLLGGSILGKTFQPYESHIPYLLQFLVDYNLYGMSYIHLSKFKFRPPLPDHYMKNDGHGNSAIWLSSTVPSALIWSDSATVGDGCVDKTSQLTRRQSICSLEVDSSVDDILNEKCKMYTSLSQARSEVKMVQSLIPIWEEYEQSGMQEARTSPDPRKPPPEDVLNNFIFGLEHEKAIAELYVEAQKSFPSNVSGINSGEKKKKCIKSSINIGNALGLLENQRSCSPHGDLLKCPIEESETSPLPCVATSQSKDAVFEEKMHEHHGLTGNFRKSSSENFEIKEPEILDTEALGLLSWLASSQAAEDMSPDYELVHEAILSPLLSTKSYKEALEKAHIDYESASQQECQDILDSVESVFESELSKEQVSSASHESVVSGSSGSMIPQVDGSVDDDSRTPQKAFHLEDDLSNRRENSSVTAGRLKSTRSGSKQRKNKPLWGPLPFPVEQKEHKITAPTFCISSHDDEMKNDSESSSSSRSKQERCHDVLKVDAGIEALGEEAGNFSACSVRDLMRRKRCFRTEPSEKEVEKYEKVAVCLEDSMHLASLRERCFATSSSSPDIESFFADRYGPEENIACKTNCISGACTKRDFQPSDHCSHVNRHSSLSLCSDRAMQSNIVQNGPLGIFKGLTCGASVGSLGSPDMDLSHPQAQSINLPEPCNSRHADTATCKSISEGYLNEVADASENFMKSVICEISGCDKTLCGGSQRLTSYTRENQSVEEDDRSHLCEKFLDDEKMQENQTCEANDTAIVGVEHILLPNACNMLSNKDGHITQERLPEMQFNGRAHSESSTGKCFEQISNHTSGGRDGVISSTKPDLITYADLDEAKDNLEHIEMSFSKNPPSKDEVARTSRDSPWITGHVDGGTQAYDDSFAYNCCIRDSSIQGMNELIPFFTRDGEDGKSYRSSHNDVNVVFFHESSLGIPTHFQNDGSVLYLLTHASSPPSLDCVCHWLFEVAQKNQLADERGDACVETSPKCDAAQHLKPGLTLSYQQKNKRSKIEKHSSCVGCVSCQQQAACIHAKEAIPMSSAHDISQISGPDLTEKSNFTPLSQIGFRDPARAGGGQQVTLMSMEVQAESRGDLLPDPKYDAINVVSLAIQEDTSNTIEVYVLMRVDNEELSQRNVDGVTGCSVLFFSEEKHLLNHFLQIISSFDPDMLMGWEIQGGSLGFLAERAQTLGISLLKGISRTPENRIDDSPIPEVCDVLSDTSIVDSVLKDSVIEDEWGRTHASGIHVSGRIVLNLWRLMRSELRLNMYSVEAVAEEVLRRKIPSITCRVLNNWFSSGPGRARYRCIEYVTERAKLNLQIMNQLDMINRTSELARVFGIDFFSVLSRGSQFRVESMLIRLAHTQNYLAISPGNQQVAAQPAMECLPLVMEPESGFYADPVVVLDFQSLYPSMIIAYNLCFSTCLGTVFPPKAHVLGVSSYLPDPVILKDLKQQLLITPNGVMYVPPKVRKGVLPRLLEEILSTRIMVKQAMKKLMPSEQVLQRIYNARQLALKLIANVTYGYTAAGFSGRMPCAELADSIVQCGRRTLETAISFVNQHNEWKARVIYGDTDSMFVLLKGCSKNEAFRIGNEIASAITAMNPNPVTLKMEKVYQPCFLLTKKRYVGYSYESPDQEKPIFDAKGIETVRRDTCPAVAKTLEQSIRLIFEHQDISLVKSYLLRQWKRTLSGRVSLQDFVFAKEVRLGTYSARASSLPPAAIVAMKALRIDPRAEPRYGDRIPYVVIHGEPGARLVDMVVDPSDLLDLNSPYRLNDLYYIKKQIIPALQRVFGLLGVNLNQWFSELPRPARSMLAKRHSYISHSGSMLESGDDRRGISKKALARSSRIDTYYCSKHCLLCGELVQVSASLCDRCSSKESLVATAIIGKASRLERDIQHLASICRQCGGGDWVLESGVKCTSLTCSVFYERRKVQKELRSISSFATASGFYPSCTVEWF